MNAITFVSDTEAWAVGDNGYITRWDGHEWQSVESPTKENLNAIAFQSLTDGWAVGDGAQILHWDGHAWSVAKPFIPKDLGPGGYFYHLEDVAVVDVDDVWAVGDVDTEGGGRPYVFHWDGLAWSEVRLDSSCRCGFTAISVLSSTDVWTVGGGDDAATFHWDGMRWHKMPNPARYWLYSISALSPSNIWVAGIEDRPGGPAYDGNILHWNGQEWSTVSVPPETGWLESIVMLSASDGWAGGADIWHWNGRTWAKVDSPDVDRIVAIKVDPKQQVWALSRSGVLLKLESGK